MAFERHAPVVAVGIGRIITTLDDPTAESGMPQRAEANIEVFMSDGSSRYVNAKVAEHFSAAVINQLIGFAAAVRTKAEAEILPE